MISPIYDIRHAYVRQGSLFRGENFIKARNQHKDVVTASGIFDRRAAKFQAGSYSSFLVNLVNSPPPALLRVTLNTGH